MITEEHVRELVEGAMDATSEFLVEVSVSPGNQILVEVDSDTGLTIDRCVAISRAVEGSFDRDQEDFELKVSSPGADQPLRNPRQYRKNIGRKVKVKTHENGKIEGELREAGEEGILVWNRTREKKEVGKGRVWVEHEHRLAYEEIRETKVILSFK